MERWWVVRNNQVSTTTLDLGEGVVVEVEIPGCLAVSTSHDGRRKRLGISRGRCGQGEDAFQHHGFVDCRNLHALYSG